MTLDISCPDCGSANLDESIPGMDAICDECGYVIEDYDDISTETLRDSNSPESSDKTRDKSWSEVSTVTNGTEERISESLEILDNLSDELGLSKDTRGKAAKIYEKAAIANLTDGRPTSLVVGASLYLSSRENGEIRPLASFSREVGSTKADIKNVAQMLHREFDVEWYLCEPVDYLPYLSQELGYDNTTRETAEQILAKFDGNNSGKSPTGFAGAALYLASDDQTTQREIAYVSGVTKETIRVRLNELREDLNTELERGVDV
ncbi:MAG: hypothetical protein SV253_10425 [Halobacteria archaeon]|nr:hypothetical protein [Halobacteria archaeon]